MKAYRSFFYQGIPVGVFSDYPVSEKLAAMGLTADVAVYATSGEVNRLKPHLKGLLVIASKLKTPVAQCLYIGNRNDKDGECARQAGMAYLILDTGRKKTYSTFSSYYQLRLRLEDWESRFSF